MNSPPTTIAALQRGLCSRARTRTTSQSAGWLDPTAYPLVGHPPRTHPGLRLRHGIERAVSPARVPCRSGPRRRCVSPLDRDCATSKRSRPHTIRNARPLRTHGHRRPGVLQRRLPSHFARPAWRGAANHQAESSPRGSVCVLGEQPLESWHPSGDASDSVRSGRHHGVAARGAAPAERGRIRDRANGLSVHFPSTVGVGAPARTRLGALAAGSAVPCAGQGFFLNGRRQSLSTPAG